MIGIMERLHKWSSDDVGETLKGIVTRLSVTKTKIRFEIVEITLKEIIPGR